MTTKRTFLDFSDKEKIEELLNSMRDREEILIFDRNGIRFIVEKINENREKICFNIGWNRDFGWPSVLLEKKEVEKLIQVLKELIKET